jgi:uncharacterized protein (UPF0335 family)
VIPEEDPSQMSPLIESMKTCQSLWKDASDKAKRYKAVVSQLEEELKTLRDANDGTKNDLFMYICTFAVGIASDLAAFVDHVTYTGRLEGEKATLEQEIEELRRKLEVPEQRHTDVEAKLVEGALTSVGDAVGILRSCLPDLNVSLISQGYNCDGGKAEELFDESQAALKLFVEKLNLSVSDEEEEE